MKRIVAVIQAAVTRVVTAALYRTVPSLKLAITRLQYNLAAKLYAHPEYKFINCGFVDLEGPSAQLDYNRPENLYVLWEGLYQRVVGDVDLRDQDVLEVGCGRGGGSEYLMNNGHPASLMAIDLSSAAIRRCQQTYQLAGLSFQTGNACALSFGPEQFDVVVNVESSHCYPSRPTFFQEVHRVLKDGGYFCFADIIDSAKEAGQLDELFQSMGLLVLQREDITASVVRSLHIIRDTPQFAEAFQRWESVGMKNSMKLTLMVIKNTLRDLGSGKVYRRWVMQKQPAS